jgi:Na+/proline symporter
MTAVLNSLCAATMNDFYINLRKDAKAENYVLTSRIFTIVWGICAIILAVYVDRLGTVVEAAVKLGSLVGSGLGGIFFLGLFTKRANSVGAFIGGIVGTVVTAYVMFKTEINWLWYYEIGLASAIVAGYLSSIIFSYIYLNHLQSTQLRNK